MLRFRLGSITVIVHPAHFLVGLMFGLSGAAQLGAEATPGAKARVIMTWIVVVFVSVLVHELGHALAFRAFGYPSTVQLVMFGGVTTPATDAPLSWGKDVVSTLAGPLFGASLGVLCWWASRAFAWSDTAYRALQLAATANAGWAVLNLLPILPMDGGRVSRALLGRVFGRGGVVAALGFGVLTCAGLAFLLYRSGGGDPVLLIFLLLFGFQNFQALISFWRTEPDGPAPPQLQEAEALFRSGRMDDARDLASQLLRADLPIAARSRIHHLLGWVALKEGEGRRALDEFSQVQGRPIEPQAVAAAFSLVGDDARAIPFWEQAAQQTRDPTILHEWAGALIRRGDVAAASALPKVDLATAYERAERVAFLRGAYSEAARFGEESLARRPSAGRAYEVACAYARAGDLRRAMTLLLRARELGYSDREAAATDPDLAPLVGEPAFQEWLASLGKSATS
ncbi:MAG TPA: site-2 protease family protein [Myxococcaceae bacterium]|nr:site-2 protease family protein [Myxococcaceae bacterium]